MLERQEWYNVGVPLGELAPALGINFFIINLTSSTFLIQLLFALNQKSVHEFEYSTLNAQEPFILYTK